MKNSYNTSMQYDFILKLCKIYFFLKKIIPVSSSKDLHYHLLMEVYNNNWINTVNYSVIEIILIQKMNQEIPKINCNDYDQCIKKAKWIMKKKNSDYKEAWKSISIFSIKDIILQKIYRIQKMKKHFIKKNYIEKIQDNYIDILNYAIFISIKKNCIS